MTRDKDFKRLVRARASEAGERYTTALQAFLHLGKEARMIRVTCEVQVGKLTDDQLRSLRERQSQAEAQLREKHPNAVVARSGEEQPVLVLTEVNGTRWLPIYCGTTEASAVVLAQEGIETERPLTHDLLRDVVVALGEAREVRITDLRDGTYFAELVAADISGSERIVPCRPSDGIALAVRADIPILVAEPLFAEATKSA